MLRSIVRDIYGQLSLVIFDLIVRESESKDGVLVEMLSMFAHVPLRAVHISCKNLQRGGFVGQNNKHKWIFNENETLQSLRNACNKIVAEDEQTQNTRYICKHCDATSDVMDAWNEIIKGNMPSCCGEEMRLETSVDDFKSIIMKLS